MPYLKDVPGVILSPEDEDLLERIVDIDSAGYLVWTWHDEEHRRHRVPMHVLIALRKYGKAGKRDQSIVVDLWNRNKRDLARGNLRLISGQANAFNNPRTDHCGVTWNHHRKKWRTRITMDGKTVYLGNYEEASDAWAAIDQFKAGPEFQSWIRHLFRDLGAA